ncbi:MAG: PSD1 and planctomycete cytochrome C domain-containing protein [Planctomycetota bacterium]
MRIVSFVIGVFLVASITCAKAEETVSFNRDIRPILSANCIACHGPDEGHRAAGLRLDIRDDALDAIEPEYPEDSELFIRITAEDEDDRMPPADHADGLTAEQIDLIRRWIEQGAEYETHWAFVAPEKPALPETEHQQWVRNEIDSLVAARLEEINLAPSADGDPHRLIRRLALDLTGLPPSPEQVERFAADPTDEVYEQIVDELLASPAYGEHWAAMWMDIARYADTMGYAEDKGRNIWPWRDWVIRAFDSNMPYDQFTTEQLAGDLLPDATDEQILATAFHRNTLNNTEGGTNNEEFRTIAVKDRISTTVNVWMGITIRCAECHTHKYDPVSQTEYYQFLDYFNHTADADTNNDEPRLDVFPIGREEILAGLDEQIAQKEQQIAELTAQIESEQSEESDEEETPEDQESAEDAEPEQSENEKRLEELNKQLQNLRNQRNAPVKVPVMREVNEDRRRETFVNIRGNFMTHGDKVTAAVPEAFNDFPEGAPANRLGVAMWLMSDDNPLTARVTVNRFWARLFGSGIVETEEDFGNQGTVPSNEQLLDWLAVDFRENGWDVKHLLKKIVMSSTYRQDNRATDEQLLKDPRNRYLARGPRFRLSAEVVRDQALAVSGLLSDKQLGPPVYPHNPVKFVRNAFTGGTHWRVSEGEDRYRRAIYTYLKRSSPHPLFDTFDMASRTVCNMRRIRTNTPLQSFMTLNDEAFIEAARALAVTMKSTGEIPRDQIAAGLERALLHPAREDHLKTLIELYEATLADYQADPAAAALMAGVEASNENKDELAALTVIANVIMNLDEFLTR